MVTAKKIEDTLFKMGLPADFEGFVFIIDIITMMNGREANWNWNSLYSAVAEKHGSKYYTVQRRIRYAIDYLRDHPQDDECYELIDKYIGFNDENTSFTLARLYRKLNRDETNEAIQTITEDYIRNIVKNVIREMIASA